MTKLELINKVKEIAKAKNIFTGNLNDKNKNQLSSFIRCLEATDEEMEKKFEELKNNYAGIAHAVESTYLTNFYHRRTVFVGGCIL